MTQKAKLVPSQQNGEMHLDHVVSRSSSSVCSTSANGAMFSGKRHHLFEAQMPIEPLIFGFSGFSGGTAARRQRGDEKGKELISKQSTAALSFLLKPDECPK